MFFLRRQRGNISPASLLLCSVCCFLHSNANGKWGSGIVTSAAALRLGTTLSMVASNRGDSGGTIASSSTESGGGEGRGKKRKAVVVGGGPCGLAAALTLASDPHCFDVTVYEMSRDEVSVAKYDASKAYLYNVNARGQVFTKRFPALVQSKLDERGVAVRGFSNFALLPADPDLPLKKGQWGGVSDGKPATDDFVARSVGDSSKSDEGEKVDAGISTTMKEQDYVSYWIPRHLMVRSLLDAIDEREAAIEEEGLSRDVSAVGRIEVVTGKACVGLENSDELSSQEESPSYPLTVVFSDVDVMNSYTRAGCHMVVGADGVNSRMRDILATSGSKLFPGWEGVNDANFRVRQYASPATGLRIKVLQLPPNFWVRDADGEKLQLRGQMTYSLRSTKTGPSDYISLGCLPVMDTTTVRPANIVTRPNHYVWTLRDGEALRKWFEEAFPRLPFGRNEAISDEEWDRFAKADGLQFPYVQYCPGKQVSSPDGTCGVVLLGDAIHAFPPDIGQGINAGLADVVALGDSLEFARNEVGGASASMIGRALAKYEKDRNPETKALIRLARFGAPYQYRQPLRIDKIGRKLWSMNVVFRMLLSKLTMGLIPPAAINLAQNPNLSFRQVMLRADTTTACFCAVLLWGLITFVRGLKLTTWLR